MPTTDTPLTTTYRGYTISITGLHYGNSFAYEIKRPTGDTLKDWTGTPAAAIDRDIEEQERAAAERNEQAARRAALRAKKLPPKPKKPALEAPFYVDGREVTLQRAVQSGSGYWSRTQYEKITKITSVEFSRWTTLVWANGVKTSKSDITVFSPRRAEIDRRLRDVAEVRNAIPVVDSPSSTAVRGNDLVVVVPEVGEEVFPITLSPEGASILLTGEPRNEWSKPALLREVARRHGFVWIEDADHFLLNASDEDTYRELTAERGRLHEETERLNSESRELLDNILNQVKTMQDAYQRELSDWHSLKNELSANT